ncbi:hypothetical protein ERC79_08585 [Rhodococcus sp. ABRD24]|uniref:hypothetical protein n=1 Tax=Rhodococcus sp. ABRD24 TaxID=2507582 RepID=UPI00103BAE0A|nr:hypothetical protein [Rhodococcus sp. ABRD24]QBJ96022.1 hypothetical protein ERC79_08585 [Rhodococcus sp. ABRD24]
MTQIDDHGHEVRVALSTAIFPLVFVHPEVADTVEMAGPVEHQLAGDRRNGHLLDRLALQDPAGVVVALRAATRVDGLPEDAHLAAIIGAVEAGQTHLQPGRVPDHRQVRQDAVDVIDPVARTSDRSDRVRRVGIRST